MITKYAELAGVEVSLRHLMYLFAPIFHRGTMLHLFHQGSKCLVVKMDDKANCQFWFKCFYVKIEDIVVNASRFPEVWNYARKHFSLLLSSFCLIHWFN